MTKVGDGGPLNERTADGSFVQAPKTDASLWVGVGTSPLLDAKRTDLSGLPDKELQQEGPAENVDPMHGLLHVLVVDDDEAVRKACCKIASGMGFSVVGADSATTARAILKHQRIDLLLLDLKLPGGGGLPGAVTRKCLSWATSARSTVRRSAKAAGWRPSYSPAARARSILSAARAPI